MAFWNRNKNWEDSYDEYYAQDRRLSPAGAQQHRIAWVPHSLALLLVGVVLMGAVGAINGRAMVEKMLTDLMMPVGIVWLALLLLTYFSLLAKMAWPALVSLGCWLILTISGNAWFSNWLVSTLEQPYQQIDVFNIEPLDWVVVLGGGTNSRAVGGSQLTFAGDRVSQAARLYHAGLVKTIICTGSQTHRSSPLDLDPGEEAAQILIGLDVPSQQVRQISGINTTEEMKNLKQLLDQSPGHGRVGILTSAYHLSRALRLAKAQGMDLVPIPSNFLASSYEPSPNIVIPSSETIDITRRACKEYLARLIGR